MNKPSTTISENTFTEHITPGHDAPASGTNEVFSGGKGRRAAVARPRHRARRRHFDVITERLCDVAAEVGGARALASLLGKPPQTMANYLAGRTQLRALDLIQIERLTGVSMRWLVTGDNPKMLREAAPTQVPAETLNVDLLVCIATLLEDGLSDTGRTMAIDQKTRFLAKAYTFCTECAKDNYVSPFEEAEKTIPKLITNFG